MGREKTVFESENDAYCNFNSIIEKFNPYHDRKGRFSSKYSAASFTKKTKDPSKQYMADAAVERAKKEDEQDEKIKSGLKKLKCKRMTNSEDIRKVFGKDTKEWMKSLNMSEVNSLSEYTLAGYSSVNDYKRGVMSHDVADTELDAGIDSTIKNLDSALSKFSNRFDIVVHRGISAKRMFGANDIEDLKNMVGLIVPEKGYSSCSVLPDKAFGKRKLGCYLQIEVPKGTGNGAYVESVSSCSYEKEFLIPSDAKYLITKVDINPKNSPYKTEAPIVHCRLVQIGDTICKFNPYHDRKGRFSSKDKSVLFTIKTKNPDKQYMADAAIERAKREHEAENKVTKPKNAGKKVDWKKEFEGVTSYEEAVDVLERNMPGVTKLAKKYTDGRNKKKDKATKGDMILSDIYEMRGFNGKPTVVGTNEFNQAVKQNKLKVFYRGFSNAYSSAKTGEEKADDFVFGDFHYAGFGVSGNGTYCALSSKGGLKTATAYAGESKNSIIRFAMDKDAVRGELGDLDAIWIETKGVTHYTKKATKTLELTDAQAETLNGIHDICYDEGRYAALRGYDYYDTSGPMGYHVVLNRGKIILDEKRCN